MSQIAARQRLYRRNRQSLVHGFDPVLTAVVGLLLFIGTLLVWAATTTRMPTDMANSNWEVPKRDWGRVWAITQTLASEIRSPTNHCTLARLTRQ